MNVLLELFICAPETEITVRYFRICRDISDHQDDPDEILTAILGEVVPGGCAGEACAHSTSWRYEMGRTILTYLVWVSIEVLSALPCCVLMVDSVVCPEASGPLTPRPRQIRLEQVLVHGLRHLRYLACERQEPLINHALVSTNAIAFIRRLPPSLAGRIGCRK